MKRAQPAIDHRPGAVPTIRTSGGDITFVMSPSGTESMGPLVIRCDAKGDVWVSIGRQPQTNR